MLSLAQSADYLFCLEWTSSDTGPKVLQHKKIKFKNSQKFYKNFLDNVLRNLKRSSINTSSSITLSIDINNVIISSFNHDPNIELNEYIDWYEKEILNPYFIENFDNYFYPLNNTDNTIMVICINKKIKNNIKISCEKHNFNLTHLTIDLFSAGSAINIYKEKNIKNYLLWKIGKNNQHYGLYYEGDAIKHFIKIKKTKKIDCIQSIGDKSKKVELINFFEKILFENKVKISSIDNIFLYQSKTGFELLKNLSKTRKITIMDIGSKVLNKKSSNKKDIQFNLLGFNENCNSLRGIDV